MGFHCLLWNANWIWIFAVWKSRWSAELFVMYLKSFLYGVSSVGGYIILLGKRFVIVMRSCTYSVILLKSVHVSKWIPLPTALFSTFIHVADQFMFFKVLCCSISPSLLLYPFFASYLRLIFFSVFKLIKYLQWLELEDF